MKIELVKPRTLRDRKFVRKDLRLTLYSLACGYIEIYKSEEKYFSEWFKTHFPAVEVSLGMEHAHFFVRVQSVDPRIETETTHGFETVTEARKTLRKTLAAIRDFPAIAIPNMTV